MDYHTDGRSRFFTILMNTKENLVVGDRVNVSLRSVGGTGLVIHRVGMTAEVNGWNHDDRCNESRRVPVALGKDRNGGLHAIALWRDREERPARWVGIHHRLLQFCREWEDLDGNLIQGELQEEVEHALETDAKK